MNCVNEFYATINLVKSVRGYIGIAIAIFAAAIFGAVAFYGYDQLVANPTGKPSPSPSSVIAQQPNEIIPSPEADETVRWKTYLSESYGFSFKYPQGFKVEERDGGFFVITLLAELTPQAGISIDARGEGNYKSFDLAISSVNDSLNISKSEKIGDWQIFVGKIAEGYGEGTEIKEAISPYKSMAIVLETIAVEPYLSLFGQILSTFEFTQ